MKKLLLPLGFAICLAFSGCFLIPPSVDVTGIWIGPWTDTAGADEGSVLLQLSQSGSDVTGTVYIIQNPDQGSANDGGPVTGNVHSNMLHLDWSSHSDWTMDSTIESGAMASGSLSLSGSSGQWTAAQVPSGTLTMTKEFQLPALYTDQFVFDGSNYWCADQWGFSLVSATDGTASSEAIPEASGAFYSGVGALTWNGTQMMNAVMGTSLILYPLAATGVEDTANAVSTALTGNGYNGMTYLNGAYWVVQTGKLIELSPAGTVLQTYALPGQHMAITNDGTSLWVTEFCPSILLQVDPSSGTVTKAYGFQGFASTSDGMDSVCVGKDGKLTGMYLEYQGAQSQAWIVTLNQN